MCQVYRALGGARGASGCLLAGRYFCGCTEQQRTMCPWSHVGILEFIFCLGASTHKTNREVRDLVEILVGTKTVNRFKDQKLNQNKNQNFIFFNVLERFKILITD